jgi:ABC-type sugar transport system substrate-binding protein
MALMEHKSIIAAVADGTPATCQCLFQGSVQRVSASLFQGSQLGGLRVAFFFLERKKKERKKNLAIRVRLCTFSSSRKKFLQFQYGDFQL